MAQRTSSSGRSMLAEMAVIAVVLFTALACNTTFAPDATPLVRSFPTSTPAVPPIASTSTPTTRPRRIPLRRSDSSATGAKGEQALYRLVEEKEKRGDVIADYLGEDEMMCVQHHLSDVREHLTHVLIRLQELGERQTRATLTHSGWGDGGQWDEAFEYFVRAWKEVVLARLAYRFSAGAIDWSNPPKFTG